MRFYDPRRSQPCEWCELDPAEQGYPLGSVRVDEDGREMPNGVETFLCDGCKSRATARLHVVVED